MDTHQDHHKNQTSGHESHGVHLCHRCGWPFPNPHPSARHRRAHKKICGTIEGYKLIDSQGSVSDDEHASDDDLKPPSPKLLDRSIKERGSGAIGERSNRSEDEVFADAVTEFPDSGSNLANEELLGKEKQLGRLTTIESFKDAESIDTFPLPEISTETGRVQNIEASESILSADKWDSQYNVMVDATLGLDTIASAEKQIKESAQDSFGAKRVSACNISAAKAETENDAVESSIDGNDVCNLRQVDAKEAEEINSGRNVMDAAVSSSDHSNSELSKEVIVTSEAAISSPDQDLADSGFQFKENQNKLDYKMPSNDIFPDFRTAEVATHSAEISKNAFPGMHSTASANSGLVYSGKGEVNDNVHTFSVSDDMPTVDIPEIRIKGFKDNKEGKLPHYVNTDALEIIDCTKDSHGSDDSSISQSKLCDDVTAASASESHGSEGYLEHKGVRSNDEARPDSLLSSDSHCLESYVDQKGMSSNPGVVPFEGETVIVKNLEEIDSSADMVAIGMEPRVVAQFPEQSTSHDFNDDFSLGTSLSQDTIILADVNSAGSVIDAAVGQATNEAVLDNNFGNEVNVHTDNDVLGGEHGQSERYDASTKATAEIDSPSKLAEENCAGEEKSSPESADNYQDLLAFSKNDINLHEKSSESNYTHVFSAPGTQLNEIESGGDKNACLDCVGGTSGAGEENPINVMSDAISPAIKLAETECTLSDGILDTSKDLKELVLVDTDKVDETSVEVGIKSEPYVTSELPENSTEDEDHKTGELRASSLDMVSSVPKSGTIDHNHSKEIGKASSADKTESASNENDCVQQQQTASVTNFSADSSSLSSVEGHWGSVSVLSTLSDIPAVAESEALASNGLQVSTDTAKTSSNKQKAEAEAPHSEKADMFDPPSFMTLEEPKSAKPSSSEIEKLHVVNSQGRKKNEDVIAKVTNWSAGKQHTSLKNILGEAKVEEKPESRNVREVEIPTQNDNGTTTSDAAKRETVKEWNSAERYDGDIKKEKRKVQARGYWAQFVCCSSVN